MKGLLFLSRLALICNVLFLVCFVIQRTHDFIGNKEIDEVVIILGWALAPFINLAVNIWYLIRVMLKRPVNLPGWLAVTNLLFLLFQLFIHFMLPS